MPDYKTIALEPESYDLLVALAVQDDRTIGREAAVLIRQEYERRAQMALPLATTSTPVEQNQMGLPLESK